MPTGAYKEVNAGSVNPSFQVGTGVGIGYFQQSMY